MAIELTLELALGIIGTVTGILSLLITFWKTLRETPRIKITDTLIQLEKKEEDKIIGKLSFNVSNLGDRATSVARVNVVLGDHVEVIEGLRNIQSHSSIRYPEKTDSEIKLFTGRKEIENLRIIVIHTHGQYEKAYKLPQIAEWDKHALWKGGPIVLEP